MQLYWDTGFKFLKARRTTVWIIEGTLKEEGRGTVAKRAVKGIRLAGNPCKVRHTAKDITRSIVKHILYAQEQRYGY